MKGFPLPGALPEGEGDKVRLRRDLNSNESRRDILSVNANLRERTTFFRMRPSALGVRRESRIAGGSQFW
jgi:hypothetical protein